MSSLRLLRLTLSFASLSALLVATACGGSDGGSGDCAGPAPSCGVIPSCSSGLGGGGGGEAAATCTEGQWECPVYSALACPAGDAGYACSSDIAIDCGTCNGEPVGQECGPEGWTCPPLSPSCGEGDDDGGACPDVAPLCGGCDDGTYVDPVCSGSEWICPILNCPYQPADGGPDSGNDGGQCHGRYCDQDGGGYDGGPYDGGGYDGGVDASPDAGGNLCAEGAPCSDGMSCTIGTAGQVPLSCECIDEQYACVP